MNQTLLSFIVVLQVIYDRRPAPDRRENGAAALLRHRGPARLDVMHHWGAMYLAYVAGVSECIWRFRGYDAAIAQSHGSEHGSRRNAGTPRCAHRLAAVMRQRAATSRALRFSGTAIVQLQFAPHRLRQPSCDRKPQSGSRRTCRCLRRPIPRREYRFHLRRHDARPRIHHRKHHAPGIDANAHADVTPVAQCVVDQVDEHAPQCMETSRADSPIARPARRQAPRRDSCRPASRATRPRRRCAAAPPRCTGAVRRQGSRQSVPPSRRAPSHRATRDLPAFRYAASRASAACADHAHRPRAHAAIPSCDPRAGDARR